MSITRQQQDRLLIKHLAIRAGEEVDRTTAPIHVTRQQLAFLLEAIEHFQRTRCPIEGRGAGCELLRWYEDARTGAVAHYCPESCIQWRDQLIEHTVPRAFPRA
ncbi:MAG: hypothetical protein HY332_09540 [Chloroflexi bacterium]|nr:hypothetical protein [Chloroflexota bacterium]